MEVVQEQAEETVQVLTGPLKQKVSDPKLHTGFTFLLATL